MNSQESIKQFEQVVSAVDDEADHILDDKPWSKSAQGEPLIPSSQNQQVKQEIEKETEAVPRAARMRRTTSNLSRNATWTAAPVAIVYESNV